ncbi:hypothetical protein B0H16DRAFT_1540236 [Mycena metata]|uniref:F-box domain-containing protein n=1 Tax=Mycena metata TaxID=1033252 RepID=A0AAD7NDR8_9AGAR|nr:hypothetical protein B0H16DRAFT_1540236 [Mycena metata]
MSFHLLANELVFLILAYIPPSDIEAFTLIDARCHALSLLALTAHLKHKHNTAAMHARFPHNPGSTSNGRDIMVANHLLEQGMLPNLEYLHLNGDLHWLRAQTPEIAAEHDRWPRGRAASPETVQKLMADAERFGLTLPTGFATLIGSQELIERLHLGGDTIALSKLLKCTPEQDGGKGGYVVRFLCDQQGCGFWGVYIDTAGHSCVVRAEGWRDFV